MCCWWRWWWGGSGEELEGREGSACADGDVVLLVVIVLEMVVLLRLHVVSMLHECAADTAGAVHGEVSIRNSIAVVWEG